MDRRRAIVLFGAMALGGEAVAQQGSARKPLLGVLLYTNPQSDPNVAALRLGLQELGYVEGRNIEIEFRSAQGRHDRLPLLADELVRLRPDVLFALGGDVAPAARDATTTIPIVFAVSSDPVRGRLVASLSHPRGNATGVTFLLDDLATKRLGLLKQAVPAISRVGLIYNPEHVDNELQESRRTAASLGIDLHPLEVRTSDDIGRVLTGIRSVEGIVVVSSRQTVANMAMIVSAARQDRIPLAGGWGAWAQAGGLLSYGPSVNEVVRRSAAYVDKILKGSRPDELPVQQPTRFELIVNLRSARDIGLSLPQSFLLQADELLE